MPCNCEYLEPQAREQESVRVLGFMKEAGLDFNHGGKIDKNYGRVATVDADTAALCAWCEANPDQISKMSLEFQIWWRDHQKYDAKRKLAELKTPFPSIRDNPYAAVLTAFKTLLEICQTKCSPHDEVILKSGHTNHDAMVYANQVLDHVYKGE